MPESSKSGSVTLSRRKLIMFASIAAAVVVAAAVAITVLVVGSGNDKSSAASGGPGNGNCTWTSFSQPTKIVALPPKKVPTTGTVTVDLTTSQGALTFTLNRAAAPCTVASFVSLAQQGYFNDSPCHRVTTAGIFIVQCGDPSGYGTGNPGYFVPDEATGKETYPAGTLAMARTADANSGGSQFFIVYKDSPTLMQHLGTLQYTVFGTVSSGLATVQKVGKAGAQSGTDGRPKLPLQILKATVS